MLPLHLKSKSTGCSSARFRVLVWGASGRKFESCHPDSDNQGLTRKCKSFFLLVDTKLTQMGKLNLNMFLC